MLVKTYTGRTLRIRPATARLTITEQHGERFVDLLAMSQNWELVSLYKGCGTKAVNKAETMLASILS